MFTPALEEAVHAHANNVTSKGKKPDTRRQYGYAERHWRQLCTAKGWSAYLTHCSREECVDRIIFWLAYENLQHGVSAGALRSKLSAIRWMHLRDKRCNPLKDLEAVSEWLKDLQKTEPAAEPKIPVPVSLIEAILLVANRDSLRGAVIAGALTTNFWWVLRSIESLADDSGVFDPGRSLTWADVVARNSHGKLLTLDQFDQAHEVTLRVFSGKNTLHTCTRTLSRTGHVTCPVEGLVRVWKAVRACKKRLPRPTEALFALEGSRVLTRKEVAEVLRAATTDSGLPPTRVSTHSLRRGGACAYAASGSVSDEAIQRFGRWTSDGYKKYVWPHAAMFEAGAKIAARFVPRFERN